MKTTIHSLALILVFIACSCTPQNESLPCHTVLRGKIIGLQPTCAGTVIQITSGTYDSKRVDAVWRDMFDSTRVYQNVFTVLECDVEHALRGIELPEPGTEFNFVFTYPTEDPELHECITCDVMVLMPVARNRITIVGDCENVGEEG